MSGKILTFGTLLSESNDSEIDFLRVNCGPCCSCSCSLNCSYSGSFGIVPCLNPRKPPARSISSNLLCPKTTSVTPKRIVVYVGVITGVVVVILVVQLFTYHIVITSSEA
ncbi:hypothetical protein E2C01_035761 [Portunus trituberculatus]|uniref:Uncharacterized protein n=1 Tax=Portunus trituberculatus TaxID=210409 RepID=A0A5B7FA19_PORTR|nr:hypothetical protein [Portunus trituberculatus]